MRDFIAMPFFVIATAFGLIYFFFVWIHLIVKYGTKEGTKRYQAMIGTRPRA